MSQKRSQAGKGAGFLTVFALVWNWFVFALMLPKSGIPFWFKAIFAMIGVIVAFGAAQLWRQRLKGGSVSLTLSQDPVPHGVPVVVEFEVDRSISADKWLVEAKIMSRSNGNSSFGMLWSQDFTATPTQSHRVRAEVALPSDFPSTAASDEDTAYLVTLTLKANGVDWTFNLETRRASASEEQFASRDALILSSTKPTYTPAQVVAQRKRWNLWLGGFVALTVVSQLAYFLDLDILPRAKAMLGVGAYSTAVQTEEFDIRVTNHLINDWALRGRLIGKARVVDGNLIVRIESLVIQPVGACTGDISACDVASAKLLLTRDGDESFSTLAQSDVIAVNANLREITRWSLPQDQVGAEIRMRLPAVVDTEGVRFKLEIRSQNNATVYPGHGPYLNLHRALAKAGAAVDPCEQLTGRLELVRAGCSERLRREGRLGEDQQGMLGRVVAALRHGVHTIAARLGFGSSAVPARETLDDLLLEALRTESFESVAVLLAAGASPNAHSADDAGRTALGYAAASNDIPMTERLLAAGADANSRKANSQGQIVTPLTQALRTDAAAAVRSLLKAGAATAIQDPTGWTPMHIAAYESAAGSIEELASAGADINERTTANRHQTPLQTALQFGNAATVSTLLRLGADRGQKDDQSKDACDWAQFFKRSKEIQGLVCL